jgi:K+/H+ antiporter YhaU regulatory subunit KhtT
MTLWEKIRDGILDISTKTGDFIKSGAEKTAETATYTSKLTQLTWERRGIQNKIEDEYVELGTLLHKLQKENRIDDLKKEAKSSFENLASYEKNLAEIDSEKELLASQHNIGRAEEKAAQKLAENLEAGGGTMKKVTIKEGSSTIGKKLRDIRLPKEALIVNVMRGTEMIIPDGNTLLQAKDEVTLLGKKEDVERAGNIFSA